MRILDIYILKNFFKKFLLLIISLIFIFILVNLFEQLGKFLNQGVKISVIFRYYLYQIPYIISLMLPLSLLLAVLFSLSELMKNNELIAMKASGISIYRILMPIYLSGIVMTFISFFWINYIVPKSNYISRSIKNNEILKRITDVSTWRYDIAYLTNEKNIAFIRKFDTKLNNLYDIWLFEKNNLNNFKIWSVQSATWDNSEWNGINIIKREFNNQFLYKKYNNKILYNFTFTPDDIKIEPKKVDEFQLKELKKEIEKKRKIGVSDIYKMETNFHFRYAFPLANLIVLLFGATFAVKGSRREKSLGILVSIFIAFIYITLVRIGEAFGYAGYLPPILAAWLGNIFFSILAIWFLIKAKYY